MDLGFCSNCCLFYSIVGFLFTGWVAIMIHKQSFYIAGMEDPDKSKSSAIGAMCMFVVAIGISIYGIKKDGEAKKEEMENPGADAYQLNTSVPDYGSRYN